MSYDRPRAISVSHITTPNWTLTNMVWRPDPNYSGHPETGVRAGEDFSLIQHGWWQWGMATVVILNRLQRGWDASRIADFMQNCRINRRWPYLVARARTE